MTAEADLLDLAYLTQFRQHVHRTHLHIQGIEYGPDVVPLPPFYTENPVSYWTTAEKAAFFHGLLVYSRLRPDLIAESVRTKNIVEVCAYMDRLEEGIRSQGQAQGAEMNGAGVNRAEMEGALEVSDAWIEWEEKQAPAIVASEAQWEILASQNSRNAETQTRRNDLLPRPRKGEAKVDKEEQNEKRAQFKLWTKEQQQRWDHEDMMRSLGVPHFKVIDNILRDDEDALAAAVVAEAASNSRQTTAEPAQVPSVYGDMDDSMIDPLLRAPPIAARSTSTSTVTSVPETSLDSLSPASRRRLRKRLYMRRKRAEAAGELPVPDATATETPMNTDIPVKAIGREKPGRKSQPRKKLKTDEGSVDVPNHIDNELEDGEEVDLRHSHVPGKTQHYKIKAQLESMKVDANALHANGLGLFHITALSKYMRMYALLQPPCSTEAPSEMSADFIQFLYAHVAQFVTELMHRTIILREQERGMKGHTKVWRFDSTQIPPAIIEHAREMMGDVRGTRDNFFQELFERLDIDEHEQDEDAADGTASDVSGQDDEADELDTDTGLPQQLPPPSPLPLQQMMYTPLVRLPTALGLRLPYVSDAGGVEPILPANPDADEEAALIEEMREEDELEATERVKGEREEQMLWSEYGPKNMLLGGKREQGLEDDVDMRLRGGKTIKSQVYVQDSDEE